MNSRVIYWIHILVLLLIVALFVASATIRQDLLGAGASGHALFQRHMPTEPDAGAMVEVGSGFLCEHHRWNFANGPVPSKLVLRPCPEY